MAELPSYRPCRLLDARTGPPTTVAATVIVNLPAARLRDVEQTWAPARDRLAASLANAGLELESGHWDWRNKLESVASAEHRLIAIECKGEIQGLLALVATPRSARSSPDADLLYVDYVEAAPWNIRQPVQAPRFLGVGTLLIGEAIRQSLGLGLGGRIGLHSLPQADRFYSERCKMTCYGPDSAYYSLMYFEHAADGATRWLTEAGLDP